MSAPSESSALADPRLPDDEAEHDGDEQPVAGASPSEAQSDDDAAPSAQPSASSSSSASPTENPTQLGPNLPGDDNGVEGGARLEEGQPSEKSDSTPVLEATPETQTQTDLERAGRSDIEARTVIPTADAEKDKETEDLKVTGAETHSLASAEPNTQPQSPVPPPHSPESPAMSTPDSSSPSSSSSASPVASSSTAPSSTRSSLADSHRSTSTSKPASLSSLPSCPTGILRAPVLPASPPPGVTFAPLPQIDGKRASGVQLGVAARSRMLRARRLALQMRVPEVDALNAFPAPAGAAALTLQQLRAMEAAGTAVRRPHPQVPFSPVIKQPGVGFTQGDEDGDGQDSRMPEEDALIALGKMVKGSARTLWRRVSHSQLKTKEKEKERATGKDGKEEKEEKADKEEKDGKDESAKARAPLKRSVSLSEPRARGRERPQSVIGSVGSEEGLTVSVLVKEPGVFDETQKAEKENQPDEKDKEKDRRGAAVEAVKVTEHLHACAGDGEDACEGGPGCEHEEHGADEEQGRVWVEAVGGEVQRRMEALAASQQDAKAAKHKLGHGLVERLVALRTKARKTRAATR